jgi:hypothetical protein
MNLDTHIHLTLQQRAGTDLDADLPIEPVRW